MKEEKHGFFEAAKQNIKTKKHSYIFKYNYMDSYRHLKAAASSARGVNTRLPQSELPQTVLWDSCSSPKLGEESDPERIFSDRISQKRHPFLKTKKSTEKEGKIIETISTFHILAIGSIL